MLNIYCSFNVELYGEQSICYNVAHPLRFRIVTIMFLVGQNFRWTKISVDPTFFLLLNKSITFVPLSFRLKGSPISFKLQQFTIISSQKTTQTDKKQKQKQKTNRKCRIFSFTYFNQFLKPQCFGKLILTYHPVIT